MPHGNPFILEFEELLPFFSVSGPGGNGQCLVTEGPAPSFGNPPPPATHIRTDQEWFVRFEWETLGPLNYLMAGTWELTVYLEQMGMGEFSLPLNTAIEPFVSAPTVYDTAFNFAAGVVPEGAYRIVTTVDMIGPGGFQGPISAVGEGPILRFYEVGP